MTTTTVHSSRQRLGDSEASRRKRRHDAAVAAQRARTTTVVDLILADVYDDGPGYGIRRDHEAAGATPVGTDQQRTAPAADEWDMPLPSPG